MNLFRFLTRSGCHLCDQARSLVLEAVSEVGGSVLEIDVDGDRQLASRYGSRIPVLLAPGGEVVAEGVLGRRSLRRSLRRYRSEG